MKIIVFLNARIVLKSFFFVSGDQLIVVCESGLQVWFNQLDENETRLNKVNFELEGIDTSGKLSSQVSSKIWKNVWGYK